MWEGRKKRTWGKSQVSGLCPVMAVVVQGDKAGTGSGGEDDWRRQRNTGGDARRPLHVSEQSRVPESPDRGVAVFTEETGQECGCH